MNTDSTQKKKTGRPSSLTPDTQAKICDSISAGNYLITACQLAGISKQTYLNWLKKGEEEANNGGGMYFDFLCATKRAEAEAEAKLVQVVRTAAIDSENWVAAMTMLERRHPERWGRKDRTSITIDETKQVTITRVEVIKDYGQGAKVIESEDREVPQLKVYTSEPEPKES